MTLGRDNDAVDRVRACRHKLCHRPVLAMSRKGPAAPWPLENLRRRSPMDPSVIAGVLCREPARR